MSQLFYIFNYYSTIFLQTNTINFLEDFDLNLFKGTKKTTNKVYNFHPANIILVKLLQYAHQCKLPMSFNAHYARQNFESLHCLRQCVYEYCHFNNSFVRVKIDI